MLVLFSASLRNIKKDITIYRRIINAIRRSGHSISHDWIETAWLMTQGRGRDADGWDLRSIVMEVESGIDAAEVVVVEASNVSTFGAGYETAIALQRHKPVLVLVRDDSIGNSYAGVLSHDLLTVKYYNEENLEKIIEDFLETNNVKTKDLRFNFVMDRQIYNHMRTKSFRLKKTKAELIRELLIKDMEKG